MIIPTIIEKNVGYDIFSRLLKDRIIFVGGREGEFAGMEENRTFRVVLWNYEKRQTEEKTVRYEGKETRCRF